MTALPPPREPGRYAVTIVCLGNICRSPMAHVVLEAKLEEAGLADRVEVTSSGTGGWHVGDPIDQRAAATLTAAGYDPTRTRSASTSPAGDRRTTWCWRWTRPTWPTSAARTTGCGCSATSIRSTPGADVPDPYYGGPAGFEEVLHMVERTTATIVAALQGELSPR